MSKNKKAQKEITLVNFNDDYSYDIDGFSVIIYSYHSKNEAVVNIPDMIDDKLVQTLARTISGSCFSGNTYIEEINLPKYLTSIKGAVFNGCTKLRKIIFQSDVVELEDSVFFGCDALEEIDLFAWEYLSPTQLNNIFGKKLSVLDSQDGDMKKIIDTIKLSYNLKRKLLLTGNFEIITFILENNIKIHLDTVNEVLEYYTQQKNITLTSIWFDYRNTNFSQDDVDKAYKDYELYEIGFQLPTLQQLMRKWCVEKIDGKLHIAGYKGDKTTETIPSYTIDGEKIWGLDCSQCHSFSPIENLVISDGIEFLADYTFKDNDSLISITLPSSLKVIGSHSFHNCKNLTDFVIPEGVTNIIVSTFVKCISLQKMVLPSSITDAGFGVFNGCENLTDVSILCDMDNLPGSFFQKCVRLENVNLPDHIVEFYNYVFYECQSLKSIILPKKLEIIGSRCFKNCTSLENIVLPENLSTVNGNAFEGCTSLQTIEIHSQIKFGIDVFADCTNLKTVVIHGDFTVASYVFTSCPDVTIVRK